MYLLSLAIKKVFVNLSANIDIQRLFYVNFFFFHKSSNIIVYNINICSLNLVFYIFY